MGKTVPSVLLCQLSEFAGLIAPLDLDAKDALSLEPVRAIAEIERTCLETFNQPDAVFPVKKEHVGDRNASGVDRGNRRINCLSSVQHANQHSSQLRQVLAFVFQWLKAHFSPLL
jgi:hypothetical protein